MGGYLGTYSSTSTIDWSQIYQQANQYQAVANQQSAQLTNYGLPTGGVYTYAPQATYVQFGGGITNYPMAGTGHSTVSVLIMDANGTQHYIAVDPMVVNHINMINQIHGNLRGVSAPLNPGTGYIPAGQLPIAKMVDGDFTLDEMAEAEKILEELSA